MVSPKTFRPKDENAISDYIKIHLDEDIRSKGIIINREVQIHRGEKTDIHVDAVIEDIDNGYFNSISVIIEVKGCWNNELSNAMQTQLIEKYLKNNNCKHGLYLIGWFNTKKWDEGDYRKKIFPNLKLLKQK